ncbi:hypothetical protein [Amycolatopsis sp. NPDC059021]
MSTLSRAAATPGTKPMVKTIGCVFCWSRHYRPFVRACGKPNPILVAA